MSKRFLVITAIAWTMSFGPAYTAELEIRIVYDNTSYDGTLREDWGFAAVVDHRGARVLFDSGTKPDLFLENLNKLRIAPDSISRAVISHHHPDHRNGIHRLLPRQPALLVYYLANFPGAAFAEAAAAGLEPRRVTAPFEVAPGIHSTGIIEGDPPEQSLLIETPGGLVMLTGCSHPGIVKMVETAERQRGRNSIRLLIGGFHLLQHEEPQIREIARRLRELGVRSIVPAHCSGDLAKQLFRQVWGDGFDTAGAGKRITLD